MVKNTMIMMIMTNKYEKVVQMPTHLGHLIRPKRIGGFRGGGLPGIHLQQIMSLWLVFSSSLSCHCHNCCHCLCLCRCYCYSTLEHNCHVQVHCHCHNRCHCLYCYARRGQCDSKKKKTQRTELTDVTAETAMFWVCPHTWQIFEIWCIILYDIKCSESVPIPGKDIIWSFDLCQSTYQF